MFVVVGVEEEIGGVVLPPLPPPERRWEGEGEEVEEEEYGGISVTMDATENVVP